MQIFVTPQEFRHSFNPPIGRDTCYRLLKEKRIKAIRPQKDYLIFAEEIQNWPLREASK